MARKKKKQKIAVIDFETDPFEHGAVIKPFSCGFYCAEFYKEFWGDDCLFALYSFLESLEDSYMIFAHNGGKFDFFFFLQEGMLSNPALVIHGRIVKCMLEKHELRDSYAIMPIPLSAYQKDEIDYKKFYRNVREKHKDEILHYMRKDCEYLFQLVDAFVDRFTAKITVGATAISELGKLHHVCRLGPEHDAIFRPYYFGGRVECFEFGELNGPWKVFDVNSMYPDAMRNVQHPVGASYIDLDETKAAQQFDRKTGKLKNFGGPYFIHFSGSHKGCFPTRTKDGLTFAPTTGEFWICSHEMQAACELGLVTVSKIHGIKVASSYQTFKEYVDKFIVEKIKGKETGNIVLELFAKLLLNSAYGKFATDPSHFKDWFFLDTGNEDSLIEFEEWRAGKPVELYQDRGRFEIWNAPAEIDDESYLDVACAASITSASRAKLMRALAHAKRPVYCDTDSIICEDLTGVPIHDTELGAWKFEGSGDTLYIAGKKLYGMELHQLDKKGKKKIKLASKGAKLELIDIQKLCRGESVSWKSMAPNFKMDGSTHYVTRKISKRY